MKERDPTTDRWFTYELVGSDNEPGGRQLYRLTGPFPGIEAAKTYASNYLQTGVILAEPPDNE